MDELAAQGTAAILAATTQTPPDLRARLRAALTAVTGFLTTDPRRAHIFIHELQSSPLLADRRRRPGWTPRSAGRPPWPARQMAGRETPGER